MPEHWAYLTRAGAEDVLVSELGDRAARIGIGVVMLEGRRAERESHEPLEPAFARQAMRTDGQARPIDPKILAEGLAQELRAAMPRKGPPRKWALQVVAPDREGRDDPRSKLAAAIDEAIGDALDQTLSPALAKAFVEDEADAELLGQIWVVNDEQALTGATQLDRVLSRHPAGRFPTDEGAPSRSALKLYEAFDWIGVGPEKGEICADLGAGAGYWAEALLQRGAKVLLIDRAKTEIELPPKRAEKVPLSPFEFVAEEMFDWIFVHPARRPIEVARLVAKWGKRSWARQMLVNLLLPMKKKVEALEEALKILAEAGWRGLRARQLYTDRDEVTVFGWLDPGLVLRGPKEPFRPRAKRPREVAEIRARDRPREVVGRGRARARARGRGRPSPRGRR